MICYLALASKTWNQESTPLLFRNNTDLVFWLTYCLPIIGIFTLINLIAVVRSAFSQSREAKVSWLLICSVNLLSWGILHYYWLYRFKYEREPIDEAILLQNRTDADEATNQAKARARNME